MEQNNIENQFRDKLNSREIKPSENSWDRLDAMLTVVEKPKKNYRWMYFAASFLGFILIATVFLTQTEEVIDSEHQKVVFEKKDIQNNENVLQKALENPSKTEEVALVSLPEKVVFKQKNKTVLKPKFNNVNDNNEPTEVALIPENNIENTQIAFKKEEINVDAKALLASVDHNQFSEAKLKNTAAIKVNTNDLLTQVDDELELSFREKVIQSVNKKYKEVKVAVANRNLE